MATVLVVEDDKLSTKILGKILRGAAHIALSAENAKDAWALLRENILVDVMVLDSQLGEGWGWDLLGEIRQDPFFQYIPVIVYTGHTERSSILKYRELGVQNMLVKPYRGELLLEEVNKALKTDWLAKLMENAPEACQRLKIPESQYHGLLISAATALEQMLADIRGVLKTRRDNPRLREHLQLIFNQSIALGLPLLKTFGESLARSIGSANTKARDNALQGIETIQLMLRKRAMAYMGVNEVGAKTMLAMPKKDLRQAFKESPAANLLAVYCRQTVEIPLWNFKDYMKNLRGANVLTPEKFTTMAGEMVRRAPFKEFLEIIPFISQAPHMSMEDLEAEIKKLPKFEPLFLKIAASLATKNNDEEGGGSNDLSGAINRLGLNKSVVLVACARIVRAAKVQSPLHLRLLLEHTLATAILSYETGRILRLMDEQMLATAGFLHDIGKWVFALGEPLLYALALALAHDDPKGAATAEKDILGLTHEEAGKKFLALAIAPALYQEAAAYHSNPGAVSRVEFTPTVAVVYLADCLAWAAAAEDEAHAQKIHSSLLATNNPVWTLLAQSGVELPMDLPEFFEAISVAAKSAVLISAVLVAEA